MKAVLCPLDDVTAACFAHLQLKEHCIAGTMIRELPPLHISEIETDTHNKAMRVTQ